MYALPSAALVGRQNTAVNLDYPVTNRIGDFLPNRSQKVGTTLDPHFRFRVEAMK
jgi:hypothetical protein